MGRIFICIGLLVIATFSCKNTNKENLHNFKRLDGKTKHSHKEEHTQFSLVNDSIKVSFTAYKTTEKLPVSGIFKTVNITKSNTATTALEAMNGTEFSIPVSSLFTNDLTRTRDPKLLMFFFAVLKNTELISGTFKVKGERCSLDVTLNGETAKIPLETKMLTENKYTFTGVMNLKKWNAAEAITSINKACEVLHTGADGVSKTWSEVAVKTQVYLVKK